MAKLSGSAKPEECEADGRGSSLPSRWRNSMYKPCDGAEPEQVLTKHPFQNVRVVNGVARYNKNQKLFNVVSVI